MQGLEETKKEKIGSVSTPVALPGSELNDNKTVDPSTEWRDLPFEALYEQLNMAPSSNEPESQTGISQGIQQPVVSDEQAVTKSNWPDFDDKEAFNMSIEGLKLAAEGKEPDAQDKLGRLYRDGKKVTKDEKKAFRLFQDSADQDWTEGISDLALCYLQGIGVQKDEVKAVVLLTKAADAKRKNPSSNAQYHLGCCHQEGIGVEKDQKEAVRLYQLAAAGGHPQAHYALYRCYQKGIGVRQDFKEAEKFLKLSAQGGYQKAEFALGITDLLNKKQITPGIVKKIYDDPSVAYLWFKRYRDGKGVMKSEETAIRFLEVSASGGYAEARYELSIRLIQGTHINRNIEKGIGLLKQAAQQGHAGSIRNLRNLDNYGQIVEEQGLERDYVEARYYLQSAVDKSNDQDARCQLALCELKGLGGEKDEHKAIARFKKLDQEGHIGGQYHLGICYRDGIGVEKDEIKARQLFNKITDKEYGDTLNHPPVAKVFSDALNALGVCHRDGLGGEKFTKEAARLFKAAADVGNGEGQYNLSRCYLEGIGRKQNPKKRLRLLALAAQTDNRQGGGVACVSAQYDLGLIHQNSKNVKEQERAFNLFQSAANQDHANAQYRLGLCYLDGIGVERDLKAAVGWFEKAAAQNHIPAQNRLGLCYQEGQGVKKDLQEARRLFRSSAKEGDYDGWIYLAFSMLKENQDLAKQDLAKYVGMMELCDSMKKPKAKFFLGLCALHGLGGVKKDLEKARKMIESAAADGDREAKGYLTRLETASSSPSKSSSSSIPVSSSSSSSASVFASLSSSSSIGISTSLSSRSSLTTDTSLPPPTHSMRFLPNTNKRKAREDEDPQTSSGKEQHTTEIGNERGSAPSMGSSL